MARQETRFFLPHLSCESAFEFEVLRNNQHRIQCMPLTEDWESQFCRFVGYPSSKLPASHIRRQQFELDSSIQSVCCCDPVLVQMTHRGAYMLGQTQLQLSPNDAIRVVTKINETLMNSDEMLYLIDQFHWLYVSKELLELESHAIIELVGKDLYGFSYQGRSASYFRNLNNEIQMLLKQMIDYGELESLTPELLLSVHFYDLINTNKEFEVPFAKQGNVLIHSENEMINTFCMNSMLSQRDYNGLDNQQAEKIALIAFDSEREHYQRLLAHWQTKVNQSNNHHLSITCRDGEIQILLEPGLLSRVFGLFR